MLTTAFVALAVILFYGIIAAYTLSMAVVAHRCGVQPTRVQLGFGPVVWRRQTRLGEIFLRVIPLGGYTQFRGFDEEAESDGPISFRTAPRWVRAAILVGGPLSSLLVGLLLLAVPAVLSAPQLEVGGAGRPVPNSSVGPMTVEAGATTAAGQRELTERTAGEIVWRLLTFRTLAGYGGWAGGFYTAGRAATESWPALFTLMGIAAIANGVCNLLPIPMLNGFHLVWLGVEAVAGRGVTDRAWLAFGFAGIAIVLTLYARLLIADVFWLRAVL